MENLEFILAFFFPLAFCLLFAFLKNAAGSNTKYIGFFGIISYVILWSWVFFNGNYNTDAEGLVFQSTQFSIIDFRFSINFEKSFLQKKCIVH